MDAVVALPRPEAQIPLARAIRSTTLISSLGAVESLGLRDAYFAALAPEHTATMQSIVAGQWLPMDLGVAHYGAIEMLAIAPEQARMNGRRVSESVQNAHFGTVVRTIGSYVTLWSVLPRMPSFIDRLVQGGTCAVYRKGPKDARVELHGIPIAAFQYVRSGWAGMLESTLGLLTRRVYVREVPEPMSTVARFDLSWV